MVPPTMPEDRAKSLGDKKHKYHMNILARVAADIIEPVGGNARLAACVVLRNDIVSFGVNEMKTHPFQARYGKNENSLFLHAETSAIKNALREITVSELGKSTLYICRIKFTDQYKKKMMFGMSKPCRGCFKCINTFDIKKVIYSLDGDGYGFL